MNGHRLQVVDGGSVNGRHASDGVGSVLIVEPHEPYRRALADAVGTGRTGFTVAGSAATRDEALEAATCLAPTAILTCVWDPADASIIRHLAGCSPAAAIVAISFREDGEAVLQALRAGAVGFLPKRAAAHEIIDVLARVTKGEVVVHPSVVSPALMWAATQLNGDAQSAVGALARLTDREREVLELLALGQRPSSIAGTLFLSRRTVEGHLTNAYRKLGVSSRIGAVRLILGIGGSDG